MARVNITDVVVLDNPAPFRNPYQFEITFDCLEELTDDLEWKVTYVGSAESEEYDQVLDTVLVGPLPAGTHKFVLQTDAPAPSKIPQNDLIGVTVVLLTCGYKAQEFIRVGYFVNVEYPEEFPELRENPPSEPDFEKLQRNILATQPRVTRFQINWNSDGENSENIPPQSTSEGIQQDGFGTSAPLACGATAAMMAEMEGAMNNKLNGTVEAPAKVILSASSTDSNSMSMEVA